MKLFRSLVIIFLFSNSLNLLAVDDPVASIIFNNPVEENNISLFVNSNSGAEAYTERVKKNDQDCLFIPTDKYAYFRVNDATITENDHNLIMTITYFDEGLGSLAIQYNSTTEKYSRQSFKKSDSKTWATVTIGITNASFKNQQNNQSDFRITEDNYIRSISISKGTLDPTTETVPTTTGSTYSEFKGKAVAGYQVWFTASSSNSGWVHWSGSEGPGPGNSSFEIYPDVRDYPQEVLHQTGFANLGNGEPSVLFSSVDVIDEHFKWMKEAGIDGVALQRFIGDNPYPITNSPQSKLKKVKKAAEENEKIFYICYDMSSGNDEDAWVQSIKFDWVYNIEQTNNLTASPAYATVDNKPVVQVWGPGFTSRVGNAAGAIELIEFLKSRGCYVIGGVPTNWRTETKDSKPGFMNAYKTYDMVSPWTPGRYKGIAECDEFKAEYLVPDKNFCDTNNLDYMPVLFPGFAWSTWNNGTPNHIPREAGNFLWRQAYNIKRSGINQMYFAMFDEYDEGTAIMKAATDWSMIPTDYYFLTLSADGTWLSSDYYLRVAGAATSMLKSSDEPSGTVAVPHSLGPVYYRNSFEKRYTEWVRNEVPGSGIYNLDPCFYKDAQLSNNNVSTAVCEIQDNEANAKSGKYVAKISGNPSSSSSASFEYKFAEVKIPVVEKLNLSFWKKTIDELGKYTSLDLTFKSGKKLSELASYVDNNGTTMNLGAGRGTVGAGYEQFTCEIGKGELIGDEITEITISYNKAADSGSFTAYFDNVLITTEDINVSAKLFEVAPYSNNKIYAYRNVLNFKDINYGADVVIYDITGRKVKSFKLNSNRVSVNLHNGIYIVSTKSENGVYSQKILIRDI